MIAQIQVEDLECKIDFSQAISIGIPLLEDKQPKCFYAPDFGINAVETENFVGDTKKGGSVNFKNIFINPHGNGTHTECVGHIAKEIYYIKDCLKQFVFPCTVISLEPTQDALGNSYISKEILKKKLQDFSCKALAIRTLPNGLYKIEKNYSDTNPAFISTEAMEYICTLGVEHLLVDLPSVDPEYDDGKLASHKIFWQYPESVQMQKTITELIFIPDEICDGTYILQFQIMNIALDASPSFPVLYNLISVK